MLKSQKIYFACIFIALYLFSELILPVNYAFSYNFYDTDIEYEYNDSYQDNQSEHVDDLRDDENDIDEVDDDSCLYSSFLTEKTYCISQAIKLNLENILDISSKLYNIVFFDAYLIQKNSYSICTTVRNNLEILRTVILLN